MNMCRRAVGHSKRDAMRIERARLEQLTAWGFIDTTAVIAAPTR